MGDFAIAIDGKNGAAKRLATKNCNVSCSTEILRASDKNGDGQLNPAEVLRLPKDTRANLLKGFTDKELMEFISDPEYTECYRNLTPKSQIMVGDVVAERKRIIDLPNKLKDSFSSNAQLLYLVDNLYPISEPSSININTVLPNSEELPIYSAFLKNRTTFNKSVYHLNVNSDLVHLLKETTKNTTGEIVEIKFLEQLNDRSQNNFSLYFRRLDLYLSASFKKVKNNKIIVDVKKFTPFDFDK